MYVYIFFSFELHVIHAHLNTLTGSNLGGAFKEMEMIAFKKKKKTIVFSLQCNMSASEKRIYAYCSDGECVCARNNLFTFAARVYR